MKIKIDDEILEDITDEEENIYQKLARATARAVDINLGKTTLADLLDGYTKSIVLQDRIDKAIENLFELKNMIYEPKTREINFDVQRKISETIKILGDKENE